ncbi:MAG: (R)-hydratase [Rhodospirillales bacterium 20-60-12]|nr:MAG: (R)-hydratase [Rhodospirillales bacterium 20-60-12]HQT65971.1 MaoC family dehydratase [Acetobacteraceae bacterium]HQU01512.1 MaoC family dehydratase [Acetobacteraceae bacterium]
MAAGVNFENLVIGQSASLGKTITEADILLFSAVSMDINPLHLNEEHAQQSIFKGRVAHGMLCGSLISALLGNSLPGPGTIYLTQSMRFRAPVRIGETVVATVEVASLDQVRKRATMKTMCHVGDKLVIEGEAVVIPPSEAMAEAAD